MPRRIWLPIAAVGVLALLAAGGWFGWQQLRGGDPAGGFTDQFTDGFTDQFPVDRAALSPTGRNPYFVLEPGYQLTLAGGREQVVVTVLDETEVVDGVTTRVVEERETANGALVEISRNFFAIDPGTGDVYYFGEDVNDYAGGRVVGHGGAWRSGVDGARFGLMMPGKPQVGLKHYQEIAPGVAMDRAEIVSTTETVRLPTGPAENVVVVEETTPLEPFEVSRKAYASGIGLIGDGSLHLVRYGPAP
jgi:hypothetical protein